MAGASGEVPDEMVRRYRTLAKGDVGLILPGMMYVHPLGRASKHQAGIHSDDMIPGLRRLVEAVHQEGGKIALQLQHAGRQTTKGTIGQTPLGPSSKGRDPVNFVKPKEMKEEQIHEAIQAFARSAGRAVEAGADGVQLHAAHGYLISQFLSPFFNHRKDTWGGSAEGRFRFLREVVLETRKALPQGKPLLVKLNTRDHTPKEGITPTLAVKYAGWLAELGVDGVEVSCGTTLYSSMNMCRGHVPVNELVRALAWWKRPAAKYLVVGRWSGRYDFEEGYNVEAARMIKPVVGETRVLVVGGLRRVSEMEEILEKGYADLISMSRPFIREPHIVRAIKEGSTDAVSCASCNRCFAAVANSMPVRCYNKGLPKRSRSDQS
jgi:2,4-dienoyl-CoA reductase-like NADH-dependent reductase (Old Yellow Enzyme family)